MPTNGRTAVIGRGASKRVPRDDPPLIRYTPVPTPEAFGTSVEARCALPSIIWNGFADDFS